MAARRIPLDPDPRSLPCPPAEHQAVIAAAKLLSRTVVECERCAQLVTAAETALDTHRELAAEMLLDALQRNEAAQGDDGELVAAVAAAKREHARAKQAQEIARERHADALRHARDEFTAEVLPQIRGLLSTTAELFQIAVDSNDTLRSVVEYAATKGASVAAPHEIALPVRNRHWLDNRLAERDQLFSPRTSGPPPRRVLVRWTVPVMPYNAGEQCALEEDEVKLQVRAGSARLVDETQAKRLGLDKLVKFDRPTKIKFSRDYTPRAGAMIPSGMITELDPVRASRVVNLDFGTAIDD